MLKISSLRSWGRSEFQDHGEGSKLGFWILNWGGDPIRSHDSLHIMIITKLLVVIILNYFFRSYIDLSWIYNNLSMKLPWICNIHYLGFPNAPSVPFLLPWPLLALPPQTLRFALSFLYFALILTYFKLHQIRTTYLGSIFCISKKVTSHKFS